VKTFRVTACFEITADDEKNAKRIFNSIKNAALSEGKMYRERPFRCNNTVYDVVLLSATEDYVSDEQDE
jgi:hypothetical protein